MSAASPFSPLGRFADWRLATQSIIGFWAFYLVTVLLRGLLGPEAMSAIGYRGINAALGLILTFLIYVTIRLFAREGSIRRMAIVAAAAALPAAVIMSAASLKMATWSDQMNEQSKITTQEGIAIVQRGQNVRIIKQGGDELEVNLPPVEDIIASKMPRLIADGTVTWYFLLAAWCAFFIAMTQQHRTRITERRLAEAETAAHAAQVRALRYQVNPHFLFNTLNSLSSLVMSGRSDRAEEMLMALSTFFRTSLSMDPSVDVSLAEEIALQRLYLDIEQVRFPDRLDVNIDIPEDLMEARVPALILQPLVENAIKYGVSSSTARVELSIRARQLDGSRMQLDVTNRSIGAKSKKPPSPTHEGTGLGLANVSQRLQAHFGTRADVRYGPIPGGYEVSLAMPVDEDD
ncbi:histidine kinase [Sphingomonas sp. RB56-2]|uniref:Histidine kinase n=1 Tax=Sphingomonas brevis TaxID=2908206 RepID=A0ABT0S8U4_9SPHN|nr:histidine kinase [Sphingomonas brevis]MCL6740821.1 histidine kinase [Sphingomonas brevis]